ncbi:hypothetical protein EON64_10765 [archaeon]|nr:MAG: hypothetical protein EON64_10765 [archaeon]
MSDEDSATAPTMEAPNRRDKNEKRTRFNLKFDSSAYQDSNGLKKSLFKIILKTSEEGKKTGAFKAIAGLMSINPLWQPYVPINEKKANAAYHRLMKQIGREIAVGRLDASPDQESLPKFLQYGLRIFSQASAKKKAEFLALEDKKSTEEGGEGDGDDADADLPLLPPVDGKAEESKDASASLPGLSLVPSKFRNYPTPTFGVLRHACQ